MMYDSTVAPQDLSLIPQPSSLSRRRFRSYPEYVEINEEWLPKLPRGWGILRYKRVARLMYGDSLPAEEREPGEVRVYGSNGPVGAHSCANTLAPALVIGRKGSYGKLNYTFEPAFAIDTTYFVDARSSDMQLRWLFYVTQLLGLDRYSEDSAIPGLSREFVYSRTLPVPTVSEQRPIAEFLDRETGKIDALVAKKEQLIALLQEKRTALITHTVTKGLDPDVPMKNSGVEWLGEIPAHWNSIPLKYLITFLTSGSRSWAEHYGDEGAIFLQSGNLDRSLGLDLSDVQHVNVPSSAEGRRTSVHLGDILICITGALTGNVAVVQQPIPESYVNQHIALVRTNRKLSDPLFLGYVLSSRIGWRQFDIMQYGGTKQGLGLDDVKSVVIPYANSDEQIRIASYLTVALSKIKVICSRIEKQIENLKEFRTALISAAVTGKIDVREEVA
jgi:type I restriction enzyme S subunit